MTASSKRPGRKAYLLITLFALLMVLFPFLFWYYTWFGRPLTARDLDQYFADKSKPRHAQHALVQLSDRLARHENVSRWYPNVVAQASSGNLELRETTAWVMGQDPTYAPFHEALRKLIHDLASAPLLKRRMPRQRPSGAVARGSERFVFGRRLADQNVRAGPHAAADQHRLAHGT